MSRKKEIPEHQKKKIDEIRLFIKNWRTLEGISQHEFSEISSTHVNTLQRFEAGKTDVSVSTLISFIDAMDGMALSQFFEGME